MKIFKFGGASIKDAAAIQNVVRIVQKYEADCPVIVVSAAGKTTNMLEEVVRAYYQQTGNAFDKLQVVKDYHLQLMRPLFSDESHSIYNEINDLWVDIEWILEEEPQDSFDYLYDQIVSMGEFLSTKIVAAYLNEQGVPTTWLDVRDCILTDNLYRDAGICWEETAERIARIVPPLREKGLVLTQGFVGGTSENFTTTLGREGSDYTAAIFSYCLGAESMTIWKDVPGVLTADPRIFSDAVLMEQVSYEEAIEMTYYGAQVIHPKTIRPLQNKQIPLYVRSFVHPEGVGTVINAEQRTDYPPIRVVKTRQALLKLSSKDFHFVDERRFARLFDKLAQHRIKVNMTQNTALSFSVCIDDVADKVERFLQDIASEYVVEKREGLKLLTLRHADSDFVQRYRQNRTVYLEEQIRSTVQLVLEESAEL